MRVDIISIFPDYFAPLDLSLIGKARTSGLLDLAVHDLRTWTSDVHRTVDDTPYGGGPGMVMRPEPWSQALDAVGPGTLIVPSPVGAPFTQAAAHELAAAEHLIFACGRYEGIDQRVIDDAADRMPVPMCPFPTRIVSHTAPHSRRNWMPSRLTTSETVVRATTRAARSSGEKRRKTHRPAPIAARA